MNESTGSAVEASDGGSALESARRHRPAVILLDVKLPDMSGLDVLKFLRSQEETIALPILVFTATGDRNDLLDALANGADDYVGKGSSTEEVRARVNTLIRAKALRERAERAEAELAVLLERERQARQEAEAANRAKDLFLATVSHELRNPLSAMLGWSRMIKTGSLDPARTARAIDTIERNAVAQARIIDDLFDVARIVAGNLGLDLAPVDLTRAIEQAVDTTRPTAAAKRITITCDLGVCAVTGDAARLQQIAGNLLSNAVKFTPAGGAVTVTLSCDGAEAVLRVQDTGPGMADTLLPHVFDRFRQGDPSITRAHAGLGLGLAIVRQLVELHEGTVSAANAPEGGAIFEVRLPVLASGAQADPTGAPLLARGQELDELEILVVEDDSDGRALLVAVLAERGAVVTEAESAEDALKRIQSRPPDVIVSDIAMPGRDGYWLMRQVGGTIPGVAVTALLRDEDRAEAEAAGFLRHVPKPLDTEELVKAIVSVAQSAPPESTS